MFHLQSSGLIRRASLLTAAVVLAGGCTSGGHPGHVPTTTTVRPASTTTTVAADQAAPAPYTWSRASAPALAIGGGATSTLSAVIAPAPTGNWEVFGTRTSATGLPTATEWQSPDSVTWTSAPFAAGPSHADAAATYKSAVVVVGAVGLGAEQQAAVWYSPSAGQPFRREAVPATSGPSSMTVVTAGALGLFATGTADGRLAIWSSVDGRQWSELTGAERVIGNTPDARVNSLLTVGDTVYAAGSGQPGPTEQAALWATSDGVNWHAVTSAASSFTGSDDLAIYSLAPYLSGLVAVGAVNNGDGWHPASWISPDGVTWSLPSTDFAAAPTSPHSGSGLGPSGGAAAVSVSAVTTLDGTGSVVAAGGGPYGQVEWQSTNGLQWHSMGLPAAVAASTSWRAGLTAATLTGTVLIDDRPGQPYVLSDRGGTWTQPSSDPATFGPVQRTAQPVTLHSAGGHLYLTVDLVSRPQTIGPATTTTAVLQSTDGTTWEPAPRDPASPPAAAGTGALDARVPSGWVAVSSVPGTPASGARPATNPAAWRSADGETWRQAATLKANPAGGLSLSSSPSSTVPAAQSNTPTVSVAGVCEETIHPSTTTTSTIPKASTTRARSPVAPRFIAAAVGSVTVLSGATDGPVAISRNPAAWSTTNGATWSAATVAGPVPGGAYDAMSGCAATTTGLVAYGSVTAAGSAPQPAVWRSTDGSLWNRVTAANLAPATTGPLVSLAVDGTDWLAAANPDPTADPFRAGAPGSAGPAAAEGTDAGVGPPSSLTDGRDGLWYTANSGSTWQLLDTAEAPWVADQQAVVDLIAFAPGTPPVAAPPTSSGGTDPAGPSGAGTPVVIGVVDGGLAVWTGQSGSGF
ncbi:MAG TPA: hypothetical protein VG435_19645 [Acidimicrobiales bacterium]|nr:hypothetical protein [Acidimicrobiales bacterium]